MEQEDLDAAALGVLSVEPRVADAHVVAHEEVARRKQPGQVREGAVRDRPRRSVENQEPALSPRPGGLRDPLGGQVIVEEIDAHGA